MVVSTAAFHAKVRGSFLRLGGLNETKVFIPHPLVKLRGREVAWLTSDLQGLNFEGSVMSLIPPSQGGFPGPI